MFYKAIDSAQGRLKVGKIYIDSAFESVEVIVTDEFNNSAYFKAHEVDRYFSKVSASEYTDYKNSLPYLCIVTLNDTLIFNEDDAILVGDKIYNASKINAITQAVKLKNGKYFQINTKHIITIEYRNINN